MDQSLRMEVRQSCPAGVHSGILILYWSCHGMDTIGLGQANCQSYLTGYFSKIQITQNDDSIKFMIIIISLYIHKRSSCFWITNLKNMPKYSLNLLFMFELK